MNSRKKNRRVFSLKNAYPLYGLFLSCCILLAAGCAGTSGLRQEPLQPDPAVRRGALENGLAYYIRQNGEPENRLYIRLAINAGSLMEDDDQQGVAHFVEHLAFDGSEHFPGTALIDFFESIGMNFGADVNAYTSFDETVYQLELPADDPEMLKTALTVVYDWMCALDFDPVKIEDERKVIDEERRLRSGAGMRLLEETIPFMIPDSRYADRFPIGTRETIQDVSRERIMDFHKKWYRPDFSSLVIVGDGDTAEIEKAVKEILSPIPAAETPLERPSYPASFPAENGMLIFRDPELSNTLIELYAQSSFTSPVTSEDLKNTLVRSISYAAFNRRMMELAQPSSSPVYAAMAGESMLVRPTAVIRAAAVPKTGSFSETFTLLLTELERMRRYGITESELDRIKQDMLASQEQAYADREKIPSSWWADTLADAALTGDIVLSPQSTYELYSKLIKDISLEEVNKAASLWFPQEGVRLVISAAENAADIPDEDTIMRLWKQGADKRKLVPYEDTSDSRPLYRKAPAAQGRIIDEKTLLSEPLKITEITLSNGVRLILNPTKFRTDEVRLMAARRGGLSRFDNEDFPSAAVAADYLELSGLNGFTPSQIQKKLAGKQVSLTPIIDSYYEGFGGSSAVKDMEDLFRLIELYFYEPYFTEDGWNQLEASMELAIQSQENTPSGQFNKALNAMLYANSPRHESISREFAAKTDKSAAEAAYRSCFSDANGFTFIFTGSFDEKRIRKYALTYLANLPSSYEDAGKSSISMSADAAPVPFPEGTPSVSVRKGIEDKSTVALFFGGVLPEASSSEEKHSRRQILAAAALLTDIHLREVFRDQMASVYAISANGSASEYPSPRYMMQIVFSCAPGREQELTDRVISELRILQSRLPDEASMTKIREAYTRNMETNLKQNAFWLTGITQSVLDSTDIACIADTEPVLRALTPEAIRQAVELYFDAENYAAGFLMPEN